MKKPTVVVALGGNALLRRGEPLEADIQRKNIATAAKTIARIAEDYNVVLVHGNGPQVGLLALQNSAYTKVSPYPLDVLGAESQGMIGYMLIQELKNLMPSRNVTALLTQVQVDPEDPAFANPTKFIGPVYEEAEARALAAEKQWSVKADGKFFRRVVPSPLPQRIVEGDAIETLIAQGHLIICTGGGGIPVTWDGQSLTGIEAVIDKDLCSSLLASQLKADLLVIATDVNAAFIDYGKPTQKAISQAHPDDMEKLGFAAGSMGPKVQAACEFARHTGKVAVIGSLADIEAIVQGSAGTRISTATPGITYL